MGRVQFGHCVDIQLERSSLHPRGGNDFGRGLELPQREGNGEAQQEDHGSHKDCAQPFLIHGRVLLHFPCCFSWVGSLSATFSPASSPPPISSWVLLRRATCTGRSSNFAPCRT